MSKPKYLNFINELEVVVNGLNTTDVKLAIGDSINNNRTLTVNQVIRYLIGSGSRKNILLGRGLKNIFGLLREDILEGRLNYRTDAVDINEFINFYGAVVVGSGDFRGVIGRTLAA